MYTADQHKRNLWFSRWDTSCVEGWTNLNFFLLLLKLWAFTAKITNFTLKYTTYVIAQQSSTISNQYSWTSPYRHRSTNSSWSQNCCKLYNVNTSTAQLETWGWVSGFLRPLPKSMLTAVVMVPTNTVQFFATGMLKYNYIAVFSGGSWGGDSDFYPILKRLPSPKSLVLTSHYMFSRMPYLTTFKLD